MRQEPGGRLSHGTAGERCTAGRWHSSGRSVDVSSALVPEVGRGRDFHEPRGHGHASVCEQWRRRRHTSMCEQCDRSVREAKAVEEGTGEITIWVSQPA